MKTTIENLSYSYGKNQIGVSATVKIYDDNDVELWSDGISFDTYISKENWYQEGIQSLINQKNQIVSLYAENMTKILNDTGKNSIEEILADIKTQVEG